jgi:hypothetical protein
MMRAKSVGLTLVILAAMLTGCGETPNRNGIVPATDIMHPIPYAPIASQLQAVMLSVGDIHDGWKLVRPTLVVSRAKAGCLTQLEPLPSPIGYGVVEYKDTEDPLPVLTEVLASYKAQRSTTLYEGLLRVFDRCKSAAFDIGGSRLTAQMSHSGPLDLGVENQAYVARVTVLSESLYIGLDLFHDGTILGGIAYTTPAGQTSSELTNYAKRALGKLELLG